MITGEPAARKRARSVRGQAERKRTSTTPAPRRSAEPTQTLKNWLKAQPEQPATITTLQTLIDHFVKVYNQHRPHRSLPHHTTPTTAYTARPKTSPTNGARTADTHDRVRTDKIDKTGCVTLRVAGKLRHIGIGRPHTGTHVLLLISDLHVRIINAATGDLLREPQIDPTRDYQPRHPTSPK
jgi:hypothetical protein